MLADPDVRGRLLACASGDGGMYSLQCQLGKHIRKTQYIRNLVSGFHAILEYLVVYVLPCAKTDFTRFHGNATSFGTLR